MNRTLDLDSLTLLTGSHGPNDAQRMCVMEAVAYVAGEDWSDHPACASPVIGAFLRSWNDTLNNEDRQQFKPYILDGETVILSPHKVYSSSTNDLVLQLRKRRIEKVVMAGPAGNLCVEAHFRDLLECGFEVAMVRDAIGGTSNEEGDGVQAALVNFRFLAHALWTTDEAVARFADLSP